MTLKTAVLARVTQDGLGYLVDKSSRQTLFFTFDKIPDYRGESIAKLGLSAGDDIEYEADANGKVTKVVIKKNSQTKLFAW